MVRKVKPIPRRDDWAQVGPVELTDGRVAMQWQNLITGETAALMGDRHPMDNQNAIVPNSIVQPNVGQLIRDEPEETAPEDDEENVTDSVRAVLVGMPDDQRADVKVYRLKPTGEEYCCQYPARTFLDGGHELIRAEWGPGKYRITLYGTTPTSPKYARRATQIVEFAQPLPGVNPGGSGRAQSVDDAIVRLLEQTNARLAALESNRRDPAQEMAQMFAVMKSMREALGITSAAPAAAPVDPFSQMLSMIKMMKMVREEIEPAPVPDDPLSSIAPKALDLLGAFVSQNQQAQAQPAFPQIETQPLAPVVQLNPAAQPQPQPQPQPESDDVQMVKLALLWLKMRAASNADVEETAAKVYEEIPDDALEILRSDQWLQALSQVEPGLSVHAEYLTKVRAKVLQFLDEESAEENAQQPPRAA